MVRWSVTACFLVVFLSYASCQVPPRLQIPGAIPVGGGGGRPTPFRAQNALPAGGPRLRRPNAIQSSGREVRPVVEEVEEPNYPIQAPTRASPFDEEVSRLAQQSLEEDDERNSPLPFRPERPVPISREQIREKPQSRPPPPAPTRPAYRQEVRNDPPPVRQAPVRQQVQERPRPAAKIPARQQVDDDDDFRGRKPVVQILRKYRTDNDDGSITWGFENDDGTWKEETLGIDCIIRGKYGYIDPDEVKREFSYEAGNKCDEPELDEDDEDLIPQKQNIPSRSKPLPYARPSAQSQQQQQQQQSQYVN